MKGTSKNGGGREETWRKRRKIEIKEDEDEESKRLRRKRKRKRGEEGYGLRLVDRLDSGLLEAKHRNECRRVREARAAASVCVGVFKVK